MKKILGILASIGLLTTTGVTVTACGKEPNSEQQPNKKKEIDVKKTANLQEGESAYLKIKNFSSLVQVTAMSENEKIATVKFEENYLVIYGVQEGETEISVKAENANDVKINIQVNSIAAMEVEIENPNLQVGENLVLRFNNYYTLAKGLQNFKIVADDPNQKILELQEITDRVTFLRPKEAGTVTFHIEAEIKPNTQAETLLKIKRSRDLTINVEKLNINKIAIDGKQIGLEIPAEGASKEYADGWILYLFKTYAPTVTFDDFETDANENLKVGDLINVIAKEESPKITGHLKVLISAERVDISFIEISDVKIGDSRESVETKIQNAIDELVLGTKKDIDYTIKYLEEKVTRDILVQAKNASTLIRYSFYITVIH